MTFFGGGGKGAKTMPRPTGRPDGKSILPVGGRVLVTRDGPGDGNVPLSDEPGHSRIGSVRVGTEAEVTAWRPRGGWGTRYRIRIDDGSEGWVDAANLQARPEPERPRRAPAPPPVKPARKVSAKREPKQVQPALARPAKARAGSTAKSAPKVATKAATKTGAKAAPKTRPKAVRKSKS
jgi:hypothetical protein